MKNVWHNSGPTQEQTCYCEPINELVRNKKQKYNHNLEIKQTYTSKEKYWKQLDTRVDLHKKHEKIRENKLSQ